MDGLRKRHSVTLGSIHDYPTEAAARKAASALRANINMETPRAQIQAISFGTLVEHYRLKEMCEDAGKMFATRETRMTSLCWQRGCLCLVRSGRRTQISSLRNRSCGPDLRSGRNLPARATRIRRPWGGLVIWSLRNMRLTRVISPVLPVIRPMGCACSRAKERCHCPSPTYAGFRSLRYCRSGGQRRPSRKTGRRSLRSHQSSVRWGICGICAGVGEHDGK
jgi:hypothetical protein